MIQQQRYMYIWGLVELWGLAGSRCAVLASAGIHGLGRVIRNDKGQENRKEAPGDRVSKCCRQRDFKVCGAFRG